MKNRGFTLFVTIAFVLVLVLSACSAGSGGTKTDEVKVGVAYCTLAEEFAVDLQKGIREKSADYGYELTEADYELDLSKAVDQFDNFINIGVNAIILFPYGDDVFADVSAKAKEKGIKIITVDSTINQNVDSYIASDNELGGYVAAKYGLEAIGGEGVVLVITPAPGMTSLEDRNAGYNRALSEFPNAQVIEQMDSGAQARAGYAQTVENALNANPDIDLILANCGDAALGALSVVELYPDKFGEVKIIGYDATPEQVTALKEKRQIIGSYAQYPYVMGTTAIESIKTLLAGGSVESVIRTGGGMVTYDNVDAFVESGFVE